MKKTIVFIILAMVMMNSVFSSFASDVRLSASEEELICRFANAAVGEDAPLAAKLGVINIVLNRLAHGDFPDTVTEVIYGSDEFECVKDGRIDKAFSLSAVDSARDALGLALLGRDPTEGALYFTHMRSGLPLSEMTFTAGGFAFGME